ncbi:MAG: endolytic transglycosylase MltG [Microbacteriaceae bacterium]
MTNEPRWDDIFPTQPGSASASPTSDSVAGAQPLTRREMRAGTGKSEGKGRGGGKSGGKGGPPDGTNSQHKPKRKRKLGWLWALLTVVVLGVSAATAVWVVFEDEVREVMGWQLPIDYEGSGNGEEVDIVIQSGEIGEDIARSLYESGVTMTFESFYRLLLVQDPPASFQPGTYSLQKQMSAQSALDALLNPENRIVARAVIPEGTTLPTLLGRVADATGVPLEELTAASTDFESLGLPADLPSLEGYLFPATYTFDPGLSAQQLLQVMVDRMNQSLAAAGVSDDQRHDVLTMAALIQKEGGSVNDFAQVSRVFANRIEQGMLLQSDATVSYGSGSTSIFTSDAERADASNPYNTYANPGLPIGPISAPGDAAINAALNPADGPWLFFVLVNGITGETVFSSTLSEHNAAVRVWQQWLRDNPDWDRG